MYLAPTKFEPLQDFYKSAPKASLERISMSARVKARIRFTRKPDDDEFTLLEVVAAPPF
jgi:preprotein translocase subunit Sss1